jgi:2-iminobutanoate/2-iminopropanoate deaminase
MINKYPLSPSRKVRNLIFVSGQIGQKEGSLISDNFMQQMAQAIENLKIILKQNNLSLENVVDVTAFLTNQDDYADFNNEYVKYFKEPYPARTTVTVKSLPLNAKFEIKATAEIE